MRPGRCARRLGPALAIACSASVAFAQPTPAPTTAAAQARFEAGSKAYTEGDFAKASAEFAAGYAAEPWSGFLFAWAQADRRRGACDTAVPLYERFLATTPPDRARVMASDAIAACGGRAPEPRAPGPPRTNPAEPAIAARVPAPEPPRTNPSEPAMPSPAPPVVRRDAPAHSNALAYTLGGLGVAVAGSGLAFYALARGDARDADRAPLHPDAAALYARAEDRLLVSRIAVGAGAALAFAATLRFALHRPRTRIAIVPSAGGASLFVSWTRNAR